MNFSPFKKRSKIGHSGYTHSPTMPFGSLSPFSLDSFSCLSPSHISRDKMKASPGFETIYMSDFKEPPNSFLHFARYDRSHVGMQSSSRYLWSHIIMEFKGALFARNDSEKQKKSGVNKEEYNKIQDQIHKALDHIHENHVFHSDIYQALNELESIDAPRVHRIRNILNIIGSK